MSDINAATLEQAAGRVIEATIELRDEVNRLKSIIEAVRDKCWAERELSAKFKNEDFRQGRAFAFDAILKIIGDDV